MLAWILPLISLASSTANFPNFLGNRVNLETLIKLAGDYAEKLPQDATTLDEVFANDFLFMLTCNLTGHQITEMGRLLSDLSVARFDQLCSNLADFHCDLNNLVKGYGNPESRWKKRLSLGKEEGPTAENCMYYSIHKHTKADWVASYCEMMASRPQDIFDPVSFNMCMRYWGVRGRVDVCRRAYLATPHGSSSAGAMDEFFTLLQVVFEDKPTEEHYQALLKYLPLGEKLKIPAGFTPEQLEVLNKVASPICGDTELTGFDPEPNADGVWPAIGYLGPNLSPLHKNLNENLPMDFVLAFWAAYHFGNTAILDNTLSLIDKANQVLGKPSTDGYMKVACRVQVFWDWLNLGMVCNGRILELYDKLRPRLGILPSAQFDDFLSLISDSGDNNIRKWHLIPIYESILATPAISSPRELEWAEAGLSLFPTPLNEEAILEMPRPTSTQEIESLKDLAIFKRWARVIAQVTPITEKDANLTFDRDSFAFVLAHCSGDKTLMAHLSQEKIPTMAISGHFKLLDVYLDYFMPTELLSLISHPGARNRLELMLHLSPKTQSLHDGQVIDKNSPEFTRWVMLKCRNGSSFDAKILGHYFENRILAKYPGFDVLKFDQNRVGWVLGVLTHPDNPPKYDGLVKAELNLTFKED